MAAKKKRSSARAKGKSQKKKRARISRTHTFTYSCRHGTCGVVPRSRHMSPGDIAVLIARGTDATIDFAKGSPFVSRTDPINLSDGVPHSEVVDSRRGTYRYRISCSECASTLHIPPEMIVP